MGASSRTGVMSVNEYLAHHGTKGMKWGSRKSSSSKPTASADAVIAKTHLATVKAGGTHALSTKDLQDLVSRMNLEQQFSSLASKSNSVNRGQSRVKQVLSIGKTLQEIHSFANSPLIKELRGEKPK